MSLRVTGIDGNVAATAIPGIAAGQEFSVWLRGTFDGTLTLTADYDGTNYDTIPGGVITATDTHKVFVNPSLSGGIKYTITNVTTSDADLNIVPVQAEADL